MTPPRGPHIPPPSPKRLPARRALPAVLAGLAWAWAASPLAAGLAWWIDLAANLLVWAIPLALAGALASAARRRYRLAMFSALALAPIGAWLAIGAATIDRHATPEIRVLQFNALTERQSTRQALDLLESSDADVIAITEAPRALLDSLRNDPALLARFPGRDMPPWDLSNTRLILSRWPLESLIDRTALPSGDARRGLRLVRVEHPRGPFTVLSLHPRSPRSPARWREGNMLVRTAIGAVRQLAPDQPLIVLADLNSTPTGYRSRSLCAALGLRRAKPPGIPGGTFPAWLPRGVALPIDDAWLSDDWTVNAWRTIGGLGSDHRAVEVALSRAPRKD